MSLKGSEILASAAELNLLRGAVIGSATNNKPLIVDASKNISGINVLNASFISGTLQTAIQNNITSVGVLENLKVNGTIGIGHSNPTRSLDIISTSPSIRLGNGSASVETLLDASGNYRINPDANVIIATNRNMIFGGTGSITGVNSVSANSLTGTLQTGSQPNITEIGALSTLSVVGDVTIGSINLPSNSQRLFINESNGRFMTFARSSLIRCDFNMNPQGDLELNLFRDLRVRNGSALRMSGPVTGVTDLTANTITGVIQTNAQPNITSVGTLTSLLVDTTIIADTLTARLISGIIQTAAQPNITSVGSLTSLNVLNTITANAINATSLSGTIQTASQPNITSLGTLSSLSVANAITSKSINADTLIGTIQTAAQPKITSIGTLSSLNVANEITTSSITATSIVGTLTTAAQPNITSIGTLSALTVANGISASSISATSITGTLATANQPNITSLGTLSALTVTNGISASSITATSLAGALITAHQPNITSIGTLNRLLLNGPIGIGVSNPTSILDIDTANSSSPCAIKMTNGTTTGSFEITTSGITLNTNGSYVSLGSGVGLRFTGGSLIGLADLNATNITGTIQTAAQPNITSLGTLTQLSSGRLGLGTDASEHFRLNVLDANGKMINMSTGDLTFIFSVINGDYTLNTSNNRLALASNVSLVLNGGTIIGLDNLTANTVHGTILTPDQPNITSFGELSNLTVNGPINANTANLVNATVAGDLTVEGSLVLSTPLSFTNFSSETAVFNANIPATSSTEGGTLTVLGGAAFSNNVFVGTSLSIGSSTITENTLDVISGLTPGVVTPNVLLLTDANKNLQGFNILSATALGGTIQDAYQPNITTIGNLSSLNVHGFLGVGTTAPMSQLEINSTSGNCLTLSYDKENNEIPSFIKLSVDNVGVGTITASGDKLALPTIVSSQIILGNSTNTVMPLEIGFVPFQMTQRYAFNTAANGHGIITPQEPFPFYNYSIRALGRILATQSVDVMSDRRTKKDITDLTDEFCTSFVQNTTPVSFHWKDGDSGKSYGYIAQDIVRAGFPDLVNLTKDDSVKEEIDEDGFINPAGVKFTVSYQHIIPILAKNQKRLMKENEELKDKINRLLEAMQTHQN